MRQITVKELLKMKDGTKVRIEYSIKDWCEYGVFDFSTSVYTLKNNSLVYKGGVFCEFQLNKFFGEKIIDTIINRDITTNGKILGFYLVETKEDETIDLEEYKKQRFESAMKYRKTLEKKTQKSTLKDGDIVTLRNGDKYRMYQNEFLAVCTTPLRVTSLDTYNDDLTSRDREWYDIVKIEHKEVVKINEKIHGVEIKDCGKQLMFLTKDENEELWRLFTYGNAKAVLLTNYHIKQFHKALSKIVEQMKGDE